MVLLTKNVMEERKLKHKCGNEKDIFNILMLPLFTLAQKTYVPDDAFEQALINLDLDDIFDDSVYTSAIDTVQILYLSNAWNC